MQPAAILLHRGVSVLSRDIELEEVPANFTVPPVGDVSHGAGLGTGIVIQVVDKIHMHSS